MLRVHEGRFNSRVSPSIVPSQVIDCVTALEIRSADYMEVEWNPSLAGRQRRLLVSRPDL